VCGVWVCVLVCGYVCVCWVCVGVCVCGCGYGYVCVCVCHITGTYLIMCEVYS